ncbi:MAG: hypothetical protein ACPG5T_06855, partial [Endozoicomonas sp.]
MSDKRVYREPKPLNKKQFLMILKSSDTEKAQEALVSLTFYEEDFDFIFSVILHCIKNGSSALKGTAILCLGH